MNIRQAKKIVKNVGQAEDINNFFIRYRLSTYQTAVNKLDCYVMHFFDIG